MSFRYHDDDSTSGSTITTVLIGAVAGFAVGMYVAQRMGGLSGIAARFKKGVAGAGIPAGEFDFVGDEYDEIDDDRDDESAERHASTVDESEDDFNGMDAVEGMSVSESEGGADGVPLLEERVLEAFNNDPVLAERAIDIGAMGGGHGVIELAGWVESDDEAEHAMTVARGVPGVQTVVNRLMIDEEEEQIGENLRRFKEGDPALREAGWEGQQVGTGRRRQGSSDEIDRHSDPKPKLEDRWLSEEEAVRHAAEDIDVAPRRGKKGSKAEARPEV
jgi:osmotically-inducible protein OsmY